MSEKFKQTRQRAGLTQHQIVVTSRVSRPTIEKMESGEPVRYELAARAVNALNELIGGNHTVESLEIATL